MKYALLLNDMRQPNVENIQVVMISDDPEKLRKWYSDQLCSQWNDGHWRKGFRPGSELEWFNPAFFGLDKLNDYHGGIWQVEDWVQVGDALIKYRSI